MHPSNGGLFPRVSPPNVGCMDRSLQRCLKHDIHALITIKSPLQASRKGKSAITIFVPTDCKKSIRAALADAGYGLSFQRGFIGLLNSLLRSQGRDEIRL